MRTIPTAFGSAGAAALIATILWLSIGFLTPPTGAAGDDISGVVTGATGGEAGVWVIAETDNLETTFRKIVVTDDDGRFLVPDLPAATYKVWARGYGLLDSSAQTASPGDDVTISATAATPAEAASMYPANYWYSLIEVPTASDFPGTGDDGNGIARGMRNQALWVDRLKDGCQLCHQMGNKATREVPNISDYDSTLHAWDQRVQIGGSGGGMNGGMNRMGRERSLQMFAGWTDRIMAGEVPPAPPRPEGLERNLVLTQYGWSNQKGFIHDEVATDKRDPTQNANGPVYGVDMMGILTVADPVRYRSLELQIPTRVDMTRRGPEYGTPTAAPVPSPYWGAEPVARTGPAQPP